MNRFIWTYGIIGGLVVCACMALAMSFGSHGVMGMALGYLSMLVALSMVFMGIKRYRDVELGGVIRFLPALGLGVGISLVAAAFYVLGWELYLYATDYSFAQVYGKSVIEAKKAAGATSAEIAQLMVEMKAFEVQYADPFFRLPMTFVEIAPVGLIVSLISAALLRKSSFMPAKVQA
jgi:hypothetical protein